jgi:hypothetical protein
MLIAIPSESCRENLGPNRPPYRPLLSRSYHSMMAAFLACWQQSRTEGDPPRLPPPRLWRPASDALQRRCKAI